MDRYSDPGDLAWPTMPSERMIDAAAHYLAGATRCKETWESSLRKSDAGDQLTDRDLMEMHGAALGMVWTTHTQDLDSALAILDLLEVNSATIHQDATDQRDLARRILESSISGPTSYWTPAKTPGLRTPASHRPRPAATSPQRAPLPN
jgi:hypothetical protein